MSDIDAQLLLDDAARCALAGGGEAALMAARAAVSVASSSGMRQRCCDVVEAYETGTADRARARMRAARAAGGEHGAE